MACLLPKWAEYTHSIKDSECRTISVTMKSVKKIMTTNKYG